MENGKTVVLVIEPEKSNQGVIKRQLEAHYVKVIQSFTLFQGKEFFEANKEILDLVFLDDFSETSEGLNYDVKNLIEEIKSHPRFVKDKIIAISNSKNHEMIKAGCHGQWSKHLLSFMKNEKFIESDKMYEV
jgi:response regulator of citrate/malate metabolism